MKIWMVLGGFDHEGCDPTDLMAFRSYEKAVEYSEEIKEQFFYHYVEIIEQELA